MRRSILCRRKLSPSGMAISNPPPPANVNNNDICIHETILVNLCLALRRMSTKPGHQGPPRYHRMAEGSAHTRGGYYIDDWFRVWQTFAFFSYRRQGKVALGSSRSIRGGRAALDGPTVFPTAVDTSLAPHLPRVKCTTNCRITNS